MSVGISTVQYCSISLQYTRTSTRTSPTPQRSYTRTRRARTLFYKIWKSRNVLNTKSYPPARTVDLQSVANRKKPTVRLVLLGYGTSARTSTSKVRTGTRTGIPVYFIIAILGKIGNVQTNTKRKIHTVPTSRITTRSSDERAWISRRPR